MRKLGPKWKPCNNELIHPCVKRIIGQKLKMKPYVAISRKIKRSIERNHVCSSWQETLSLLLNIQKLKICSIVQSNKHYCSLDFYKYTVCLLFKDRSFKKTKTQGEMVEIERGGEAFTKLSCGRPKQKRPIRVMIIHYLRIYTTTHVFFKAPFH